MLANTNNRIILERWDTLALADGWLVAGCLFQTVWNLQAGRAPEQNIKDYDLFYFDKDDLSEQGERAVQARVDAVLADLGVKIEVANQARVHTWYEAYFGHPYPALRSACDGIDRFLIPATCVGIRPDAVYAPNGLDLFQQKAASYRARWPSLSMVQPE